MPLLRLLHQISNMYQNVKETQSELREQQPDNKNNAPKTPPANNNSGKFNFTKIINYYVLLNNFSIVFQQCIS